MDECYIIGSNAGRLCFLGTDKKTEPLDANVLNRCIRQVAVHKGVDGVYICLVCGAEEGDSFAVAFVDTENRRLESRTFKIAAKPAKVVRHLLRRRDDHPRRLPIEGIALQG